MGKLAYQTTAKTPEKRNVPPENVNNTSIPNSAFLGMLGSTAGNSSENPQPRMESLKNSIQSRLTSALPQQSQIPAAEREADRLSASLTTGTPDSVKATMSQKLGADFSRVRIHTDRDSAAHADAIGARAFTMGSDIYFGSEGFDAGTAAHELVHTAQQGAVTGASVATSAPLGSIQMKPKKKDPATQSTAAPAPATQATVAPTAATQTTAAPVAATQTTAAPEPAVQQQPGLWSRFLSGAKAVGSKIASGAKTVGSKISSGAKTLGGKISSGAKTLGGKISSGAKSLGEKIAYGADVFWDATGGRLARWNDEAIEDYTESQDKGEWEDVPAWEKAKWIMRNPIAWMRAQKESNREAARIRMKEHDLDDQWVRDNLVGKASDQPSSMIDNKGSQKDEDESGGTDNFLEKLPDIADGGISSGELISRVVDKSKGLNDDSARTTGFGHAGNTFGLIKDGYDLYSNFKEQKEMQAQGLNQDAQRTRANMVGTALGMGAKAAGFFSGKGSEIAGGVLGAGTGFLQAGTGIHQALAGRKQRLGAQEVQADILKDDKGKTLSRKDLLGDTLLLHDTAVQAAMSGRKQEIEGAGEATTGMIDSISSIANATGGGIVAGGVLMGANTAAKAGFKLAQWLQHKKMVAELTKQTIGDLKPQIQQFLDAHQLKNTAKNQRRAKRAIVRVKGNTRTGHREELFLDQTAKRGSRLAEIATAARNKASGDKPTKDESQALKLMNAMGIDAVEQEVDDPKNSGQKIKKKVYSEEAATTKLGATESRQAYVDRVRTLSAAARVAREKKKQNAQQSTPQTAPQNP